MSDFKTRLNHARNGNGLLFCGAGFTADCLNFDPSTTVGTGSHLLNILNAELQLDQNSAYQNIQNAADAYREQFGDIALMNLLIDRYTIQNPSSDIVDVMRFPWDRIYTTNYDNGIEQALRSAGRKYRSFNNLDTPKDIGKLLPVIHLHGFVDTWNPRNFNSSCILGSESYHQLDSISSWLGRFRVDVERAELVVFVGYRADDFHLNHVLYNVADVREKTYFINRSTATPDPDTQMTHKRFGQPFYIGRTDFANMITQALQGEPPTEPTLASFRRYKSAEPEDGLPSVTDIEDMFLFGRINCGQIARDTTLNISHYHVQRHLVSEILDSFTRSVRVALIVGEICDGKTLILENLSNRLSVSRQVFRLNHSYEDLLDEASGILHAYPKAALVIENCFEIREDRLATLARMFDGSDGLLLLSSRNISAEAEAPRLQRLGENRNFRQYSLGPLTNSEIKDLIALMDQIAAWRYMLANKGSDKKQFIVKTCRASLPSVLLRLLKSEYVRNRYMEEYNKVAQLTRPQQALVVAALYISHIGHNAPLGFLSNAFRIDAGGMLDEINRGQIGFRLLRVGMGYVETVPSIGATNILEHIISDRDIVDSIVVVLRYLSEDGRYGDFERYIFGQMMRYSILRSVVKDHDQINRFFDNISKHRYLRSRILFWLQWHMAKTDMGEFDAAEKYLDQGYAQARQYERDTGSRYDRNHLDDRKAKFLMRRDQVIERSPVALYQDMKEACEIVFRLLRTEVLTHHPFETIEVISRTFISKREELLSVHRDPIQRKIDKLVERANASLRRVPQGYQQRRATEALRQHNLLKVPPT